MCCVVLVCMCVSVGVVWFLVCVWCLCGWVVYVCDVLSVCMCVHVCVAWFLPACVYAWVWWCMCMMCGAWYLCLCMCVDSVWRLSFCVCVVCVCAVWYMVSACTCACVVSALACMCTRVCMLSDSKISFQAVFPLILCDLLAGGWVKVMPAMLKLAQIGTQAAWDNGVAELSGWSWGQSSRAETAG